MAITDWPKYEQPRQKFIHQGPQALSDAELLAIFLRTGVKGKSAVDLARDLINDFGSLRQLLLAKQEAFCRAQGLGLAKFVQLQAILELAKRHLFEEMKARSWLSHIQEAKDYLRTYFSLHTHEAFVGVFLDQQQAVLACETLFEGTVNRSAVYPREVAKRALELNAVGIVVAHNHPSGNPTPSTEDRVMTEQLSRALELLDIQLLDHLVVGETWVYSFAEHDEMTWNPKKT